MATQLQKLGFIIDLVDKVSGPALKIQKQLSSVADNVADQYDRMAGGAAGLVGAGAGLYAMAAPAHEIHLALGEVKSLDATEDALGALADAAMANAIKYGGAATDFIRASYDIQSGIAGLQGDELANFTSASSTFAKATKADMATATDYTATMYGIFKDQADAMGKSAWADQMLGQSAVAVKMYKTNGQKIADSFSSIGASATSMGISMEEQTAILGRLGATMEGSEAGTKYNAFLAGIGGAQEKLGLSFVDSQGNMLGMVEILEKIKGKFGETLSVAESDALSEALGSDEATGLIKLLMNDTTGLAEDIGKLSKVKGLEDATKMADEMIDPLARGREGIRAMSAGFGQTLLPVIHRGANLIADLGEAVFNWTQKHPELAKWVGITALGVTGLIAGVSALSIGMAFASMTSSGWALVMPILSGGMNMVRTAALFMNAAIMANPIGAIIAVAIGAVMLLIAYWDDLKATFSDVEWIQNLMGWIEGLLGKVTDFLGGIDWINDALSAIGFGGDEAVPVPAPVVPETAGVSPSTSATLGANIPQSTIDAMSASQGVTPQEAMNHPPTPAALKEGRTDRVPRGGAGKAVGDSIANNTTNQGNTYHNNIYTTRPNTHQDVTGALFAGGA